MKTVKLLNELRSFAVPDYLQVKIVHRKDGVDEHYHIKPHQSPIEGLQHLRNVKELNQWKSNPVADALIPADKESAQLLVDISKQAGSGFGWEEWRNPTTGPKIISQVKDPDTLEQIQDQLDRTALKGHDFTLKLHEAFDVHYDDPRHEAYKQVFGDTKNFYHGVGNDRVGSLVATGFKLPRNITSDTGQEGMVTGNMFGPGVYLAPNSTKAGQYIGGSKWWDKKGKQLETGFLLETEAVTGTPYKAKTAIPSGLYDVQDELDREHHATVQAKENLKIHHQNIMDYKKSIDAMGENSSLRDVFETIKTASDLLDTDRAGISSDRFPSLKLAKQDEKTFKTWSNDSIKKLNGIIHSDQRLQGARVVDRVYQSVDEALSAETHGTLTDFVDHLKKKAGFFNSLSDPTEEYAAALKTAGIKTYTDFKEKIIQSRKTGILDGMMGGFHVIQTPGDDTPWVGYETKDGSWMLSPENGVSMDFIGSLTGKNSAAEIKSAFTEARGKRYGKEKEDVAFEHQGKKITHDTFYKLCQMSEAMAQSLKGKVEDDMEDYFYDTVESTGEGKKLKESQIKKLKGFSSRSLDGYADRYAQEAHSETKRKVLTMGDYQSIEALTKKEGGSVEHPETVALDPHQVKVKRILRVERVPKWRS